MPNKLLAMLLYIFLLAACHDSAKELAQSQQLAAQTLQHLSFIQGGSYMMGDFGNYSLNKDNKFSHKVTLDSFSMAQYRITWQQFNQWLTLQHRPSSKTYTELKNDHTYIPQWIKTTGDNYPASVDWQDAKDYCLWLGKVSGLPVDLPTEAQWEYAARNRGQNLLFVTDNKLSPGKLSAEDIEPVGLYPPNPLGLYDMIGNGWDWMNDWYAADYYSHSPEHNPQGPKTGTDKVARGTNDYGGFGTQAQTITRFDRAPKISPIPSQGFRCVVNQTTPVKFASPTAASSQGTAQ